MGTFMLIVHIAIFLAIIWNVYATRSPALLFVWVIVVTTYLYLSGQYWRHPLGFVGSADASGNSSKDIPVEQDIDKPYASDKILSVDDYEYNMIFKNEGDRAMTKQTRDLLMSKYPMDWSVQPPSSDLFQQGLAAYKESFQNPPPPPTGPSPYKEIDGSQMVPPDTKADEMKEREILATYVPKKPQELSTYDAADAKEIIDKIYGAKGLVADVRETGPNQFTIVGTRKINEKVVYEDEEGTAAAPASTEPVQAAGEGTIVVPAVAAEVQQGLDPFFTPGPRTRDQPWDYTRWTPGLERMFAPTEAQTNWY
jgi:hypothetical protein